jgi:hypothetical protein
MINKKKQQRVSQETQDEALKIASAIQRPGQTKEQKKLIAQGIQKGIALYKKQQKAKSRELDKRIKKVTSKNNQPPSGEENNPATIVKQQRLPWLLLVLSWLAFITYIIVTENYQSM